MKTSRSLVAFFVNKVSKPLLLLLLLLLPRTRVCVFFMFFHLLLYLSHLFTKILAREPFLS
tara:strand:+ start:557 stop:739 length:183 start_codon:yes stop_codon:yes gene_type:complete